MRLEVGNLLLQVGLALRASGGGSVGLGKLNFQLLDFRVASLALLLVHQRLQLCTQACKFRGVVLGIPCVGDGSLEVAVVLRAPSELVDLVADRLLAGAVVGIARRIAGADGVGPLEHHVFKEVTDASDAGALIDGAHLGQPASRYGVRLIMPRHQQKFHTVGKCEDFRLHLLGASRRGEGEGGGKQGDNGGEAHAFLRCGEVSGVVPGPQIRGCAGYCA